MSRTIHLPEGHDWQEGVMPFAQVFGWECARCGATFDHDVEAGESCLEDGDGSCNEDAQAIEVLAHFATETTDDA